MDITDLLVLAQRNKASDLHLSAGQVPMLRVNGDIVSPSLPPLPGAAIKDMLYSIMSEHQRSLYERELELDFAIAFGDGMRFRINAYNTIHGPAAVLRAIPNAIRTLDDLHAPPILKRLAELHGGLLIVTGATGSGKTTTLAGVVDHINCHFPKHILTIEDPIEVVHASKKSLINQREIGKSTLDINRALRSALREDPDVILVGELRDLETIQLALSAAETGHLVLATMHTNSAPDSIDRIIDVFPSSSKEMVRTMLSNVLQGVVAQTLLKTTSGGRAAAFEVMVGTPAVRNLIREAKVPQLYSMMQMGARYGMFTMRDNIQDLVEAGTISSDIGKAAIIGLSRDGVTLEQQPAEPSPFGTAERKAPGSDQRAGNSGGNVF